MRIGMLVPQLGYQGGLERYARDLAVALAARGHEQVLIHGPQRGRDPDDYARPFSRVVPLSDPGDVRGLDVVLAHRADDVRDLEPLAGVPMAIASQDHDHTCVRSYRYLPVTHEPCHRPPGIECVTHGCVVVRNRLAGARLPVRVSSPFALRRRLLALAERAPLLACSRYIAGNLIRAGVAPSRVYVNHLIPPHVDAPLKERPPEPKLLAVGQLIRGKGIDLAIEALAHLPAEVTLDIAGDGPSRASWEALAARVAPGRVRFLGYLSPDRVSTLYDDYSVSIVPSRMPEPFGMVGIEAMRRARPVVGADHGGIPEWLEHGVGGLLFAPGSPKSLASAAKALLDDPEAGLRAHRHASAHFPHAAMVDRVEDILGRVARRSR